MAETVIVLAPGEERIIRVTCGAAAAAVEEQLPTNSNVAPPLNTDSANSDDSSRMAMRKTRKNRKNNGATRKDRKQSGGKRGMNPFMKFASKERKNIMSSNPGMAVTEVGKELGARWRALSDAEKKKYSS